MQPIFARAHNRALQPALRRTFALTFAALLLSAGCASEPADGTSRDDDEEDADENDDNDEDQSPASDKDAGPRRDSGGGGGASSGKDSGSNGGGGASSGKDSGSNGGGGASGGGSGKCTLVPNEDGWIAETTNDAKLQGSFYTYASDGSMIDPLTSASSPFKTAGDGKLCVKGSAAVVLEMMYSKYFGAGLAFDVCAAAGSAGAASGKRTLSECPGASDLLGIKFKLSGETIPTELRVTFHEAMRDESTYVLAKEGANEALIAKATVAYATTPAPAANTGKIDSIHFAIPTNTSDETPFDFCVEDIQVLTKTGACGDGSGGTGGNTGGVDAGKTDAGGSSGGGSDAGSGGGGSTDAGNGGNTGGNTGGGTCSKTGAWTSSDKFATKAYGKYMLRNNVWQPNTQGLGNQTIWGNSAKCWGVDANHTDPAGAKGNVKSYPNVMRGWSIQAPATANHGLNIRVSDIQKAKIRWKFQAPASGRMWALWDIYFHESANPPYNSAEKAPVNLMIQQYVVDQTGWFQGPQHSGSWPKVTIDGVTYREAFNDSPQSFSRDQVKLYVDGESGATMGKKELTIDLKQVIDAYVEKGKIKSTDYLTGIQAGFEIVEGGSYVVEDFWTAINDEPEGN
jgi:hypothetical protein